MEIVRGIHGVDFEGRVWGYVIEGEGLTLIDAGIAGQMQVLTDVLAGIGASPTDVKRIILTHFHRDHIGTAAELRELTNAEVIAHMADAEVIEGSTAEPAPNLTAEEEEIFEGVAGGVPAAPPVRVDRRVEDGESIDLGLGLPARVVHVPGHTAGSIAIHLPVSGVLFTGDAAASMNGRPIVGVFNVDRGEARRSFGRLAVLESEIACFGHGDPIREAALRALQRTAERIRA